MKKDLKVPFSQAFMGAQLSITIVAELRAEL